MTISPAEAGIVVLIGLVAGTLGGMLGVGGSVVMIPALAIMFAGSALADQHLLQAAAMIANVCVAIPAARRHSKAGALDVNTFKKTLPAAIIAIVLGVLVSNQFDAQTLRRLFAAFLVYVVVMNTQKLLRKKSAPAAQDALHPVPAGVTQVVGGSQGLSAGLLGIGGGGIAVPLWNTLGKQPLTRAIALSSAVMCLTAPVGAALKVLTLQQLGQPPANALLLGVALAPSAVVGGMLGAQLTHRLPVRVVRLCFTLMAAAAAWRMATA